LRGQILQEREQKEMAVSQVNELLKAIQDRHRKVLVRIREEKAHAHAQGHDITVSSVPLPTLDLPSFTSITRTSSSIAVAAVPSSSTLWPRSSSATDRSELMDVPQISVHNASSNMAMLIPSLPRHAPASSVAMPIPLTPQTVATRAAAHRGSVVVDKGEYAELQQRFIRAQDRIMQLESYQETALQAEDSWAVERKKWQHELNDMTLQRHIARQDQARYNTILKTVLVSMLVKVMHLASTTAPLMLDMS
jgi:hypothetical protein